jgi:hypothetical protein
VHGQCLRQRCGKPFTLEFAGQAGNFLAVGRKQHQRRIAAQAQLRGQRCAPALSPSSWQHNSWRLSACTALCAKISDLTRLHGGHHCAPQYRNKGCCCAAA